MPYQNRYTTIILSGTLSNGVEFDAADCTAAEYSIYSCAAGNQSSGTQNSSAIIQKTLAGGGLTVVVLDGKNVLQCRLTAAETQNFCGKVYHELKVATTGQEWLGVQITNPTLTFTPTRS